MIDPTSRFRLGSVHIALDALAVHRDDGTLRLTPTEAALLERLLRADGEIVTTPDLLQDVWGYKRTVKTRTVDTTVGRLRKKIEVDPKEPQHLLTHRGVGLALVDAVAAPRLPAAAITALIGRDALVDEVEQTLRRGRLVILTGLVGVGTSAIARQVAARWTSDAVVLDLHGRTTLDDLTTTLAARLGQTVSPGIDGLIAALQTVEGPLLVLDGLDAADGLDLEPLCRAVVVLAVGTPVGTRDEVVLRVPPLERPDAQRLVERELGRQGLDVDPATLDVLLERAGGLPLVLRLLAPVAALFGVDDLDPGVALRDAASLALARLDPDRLALLGDLGSFHGAIDAAAAQSVWNTTPLETRAHLVRLVDTGLVAHDGRLFRILRGVRKLLPPVRPEARARWLTFLTGLRDSALRDHGTLVARHAADLREALELVDDPADVEDLFVAFSDYRMLHCEPMGTPLLTVIAERYPTPRIRFLEAVIASRSGNLPDSDELERMEAPARAGDFRSLFLLTVCSTDPSRRHSRLQAALQHDVRGDIGDEARFLTGLLAGLEPEIWLDRTQRLRTSARREGWTTVAQHLLVTYASTLLRHGRAAEIVLLDIDLDDMPPLFRSQTGNILAAAHYLSGDLDQALEVCGSAVVGTTAAAIQLRQILTLAAGERPERFAIDPLMMVAPVRHDLHRAIANLAAGRPPHIGKASFDCLFDPDARPPFNLPSAWALRHLWLTRRDG